MPRPAFRPACPTFSPCGGAPVSRYAGAGGGTVLAEEPHRVTRTCTILAHRGNIDGPCADENALSSMRVALERGWGIETDIRHEGRGRFYISHDRRPVPEGRSADAFCSLFRQFPEATIALNVKELGAERQLLGYLARQQVIDQVFLFDMELIEDVPGTTARTLRCCHPTVRLAARASDRGEPVDQALRITDASICWIDEFDSAWCTAADVQRLQAAGRTVYAVSPDLHRHSLRDTRDRWDDFIRWGVDGVCTDYPAALEERLVGLGRGKAA